MRDRQAAVRKYSSTCQGRKDIKIGVIAPVCMTRHALHESSGPPPPRRAGTGHIAVVPSLARTLRQW
jgi:hypothetical protein